MLLVEGIPSLTNNHNSKKNAKSVLGIDDRKASNKALSINKRSKLAGKR